MSDSALVHQYSLPRCLVRGIANTDVSTKILNPDGSGVTFDSADGYALYQGSRQLHSTTDITSGLGTGLLFLTSGIPAASLPSTEALSDTLIEEWTVTIGGQVHVFSQPVYLVRQMLNPTITDTDLTALHSDLLDHIDPDQTTFERQRVDAWVMLNKWLIKKGNRPQLILDDWMLRDVHRYLALYIIASDFASSVGDGRWRELAHGNPQAGVMGYLAKAQKEFDSLNFQYDHDQDGRPEVGDNKSASAVLMLQEPREDAWWYR